VHCFDKGQLSQLVTAVAVELASCFIISFPYFAVAVVAIQFAAD
jgi:hypothetical protein